MHTFGLRWTVLLGAVRAGPVEGPATGSSSASMVGGTRSRGSEGRMTGEESAGPSPFMMKHVSCCADRLNGNGLLT